MRETRGLHSSYPWWSLALALSGNDGLLSSSISARDGAVASETTQGFGIVKQRYFAVSDRLLLWVALIYRQSMSATNRDR